MKLKNGLFVLKINSIKTKTLLSIGLLLATCNSYAQAPSEPFKVGVTTPLTLKIDTEKIATKCNLEITISGVGNIEKEITSPNYEAVIEITPKQEGQINIQWKGKAKFRGFHSTQACTGIGSVVITATASNAQAQTNAAKEVQVAIPEKMVDASSKITSSTNECKVLDADISGSYSGGCKDGLANGEGVAKGKDEYRGMFVNGKPHGKGTYTWQSGDKYVGDFVDDKQQGKGIFTFQNGDKYVGDFANGKFHGNGAYTEQSGKKYVGNFIDGKPHGKGTSTSLSYTANAQGSPGTSEDNVNKNEQVALKVCEIIEQDQVWGQAISKAQAIEKIIEEDQPNLKNRIAYGLTSFSRSAFEAAFEDNNAKATWKEIADYEIKQRFLRVIRSCGYDLHKKGKFNFQMSEDKVPAFIEKIDACIKDNEKNYNEVMTGPRFSDSSNAVKVERITYNSKCSDVFDQRGYYRFPFPFHLLIKGGGEKFIELVDTPKYKSWSENSDRALAEAKERLKKKIADKGIREKKNTLELAQKKRDQEELNQRISKIKNGNIAAAKNCGEVAQALIPEGEVVRSFGYLVSTDSRAVYRTATKKLYASAGKLISYKGKQATIFGIDPLTNVKYAFILKFSDKTLWFADRLAIGTDLYFVGRYVDNDTVSIKQGSNEFDVTARVYEVLCASSM